MLCWPLSKQGAEENSAILILISNSRNWKPSGILKTCYLVRRMTSNKKVLNLKIPDIFVHRITKQTVDIFQSRSGKVHEKAYGGPSLPWQQQGNVTFAEALGMFYSYEQMAKCWLNWLSLSPIRVKVSLRYPFIVQKRSAEYMKCQII